MAVYTDVSDGDIASFINHYEIGGLVSFKGIAEGVENSNYLLLTDSAPYILTLYEKRVKRDDLPFFLGLMKYLASRGVPCPTPLKARDGEVLRELCGRPAAIISFLKGVWPRKITFSHCRALGRSLAELHLAGQGFRLQRANALTVVGWHDLFATCRNRVDQVETGLVRKLNRELDYIDQHWPKNLPHGVIHADLFPDNVFFDGNRLTGLIDFYFACNDQFAYDLAVCMNAWCFEHNGKFNITKSRQLLSAYQRVRPLSNTELESLPILSRGAAVRFLLTRLYDWINRVEGALVNPKDPLEYLCKLRFHQSVSSVEAYGLAR